MDFCRIAFIFFGVCFCTSFALSQQKNLGFHQLGVDDGLSQNWVSVAQRDSYGFMWFGTMEGLNRYNGHTVKVYKHDADDTSSLTNNRILSLLEDSKGNLWVGTNAGLNLYDRNSDSFIRFRHDSTDTTTLCADYVRVIFEDKAGRIWIGTQAGLNLFNPEKQSFTRFYPYPEDIASIHNNIISIAQNKKGKLFIVTLKKRFILFDPVTHTFTTHKLTNPDYSNWEGPQNNIFLDSDGDRWIPNGNRIFYYERGADKVEQIAGSETIAKGDIVTDFFEDRHGDIWFITDRGTVNRIDKEDYSIKSTMIYRNDIRTPYVKGLTSLYIDDTGTMWIGSYKQGVSYYKKSINKFELYTVNPSITNSLKNININCITKDSDGKIWIGSDEGGISIFNPKSEIFSSFSPPEESLKKIAIVSMAEDKDKRMWIGTYMMGLRMYNRKTKEYIKYTHDANDPTSLSNNSIWSIIEDSKGRLWIATLGGGLNLLERKTGKFKRFNTHNSNLSNDFLSHLNEDSKGNIWIGSSHGLNVLKPETETIQSYVNDPADPQSLSENHIHSVVEDDRGWIWIATSGGLNLFNPSNESFRVFTKEDGLPTNTLRRIEKDKNGNLWISTANGVSKAIISQVVDIDSFSISFSNYDVTDNLQGKEFSETASCVSREGKIYFGGIGGLNAFYPEDITIDTTEVPVLITDFKIYNNSIRVGDKLNNRVVLTNPIYNTDEIILKHNEDFFTIEFAALDYFYPEKNKYAYMLEGFHKQWIYTQKNERYVTFTNLKPGSYTFRVKGTNNDGIWNEKATTLKIIVQSPFWGTWYFKTGVVLLILGILFFIYYIRMRVVQAQKQELARQVAEKTQDLSKINNELNQFAYVVSHDLKAPLRGITNLANWMEEDLEDLDVALDQDVKDNFALMKDRVGRMQKLIDGILNYSRVGRTKAEKERINSREVVDEVVNILNIPEGFNIDIKGTFPEIISNRTWLEQVFTNLVNNALKYHDKTEGKITIAYDEDARHHIFSVADDGPGIAPDYQEKIFMIFQTLESKDKTDSTGIGLTIVKKIVEEQGGTIRVESDGKSGSKFIFTIPKAL